MTLKVIAKICTVIVSSFATAAIAATTIHPQALNTPLANPGIGAVSFHQGYGVVLGKRDYPETGVEYERFYWKELEPEEGRYKFSLIDDAIAYASKQQPAMNVAVRFMALAEPESGTQIPDWLLKKGIKGSWTPDRKTFIPDLTDPLFIKYSQRLLNAFGHRFDGNPDLLFIDIGMVGSWGEWHNSNFPSQKPLAQAYTTDQLFQYVKMHFDAFPRTPKVMLISGGDNLARAARLGAGWRADCWGDLRVFSSDWNHMRDDYPQRLQKAKANYAGFSDLLPVD